ncbi:MAG: flagellar hook protein FlgE [Bryobacterales bacterium]|nr:flagellar hook protein FlgE [Bryobacterales bacterium]
MAFTAFSTALSALSAHTTAVDVVGNNLANLNTAGFKTSNVVFHDLVTQTLGLGETQVGLGVARPLTLRQFSQGALQSTGGSLDGAIQGDGFFVLRDAAGALMFTRAGTFHTDLDGNLLTPTGERVQGWTETAGVVDTNGPIGNIVVPVGTLRPPQATTAFALSLNLNSAGAVGGPGGTFSTPVEIVDSLGVAHVLTVTFTKTDANEWGYDVSMPGGDLAAGTPGTPFSLGNGTITFDANGRLATPANPPGTVPFAAAGLTSGAADLAMDWQLYEPDGAPKLTQYAQTSAVAAVSQDGAAAAQLVKVGLADGGVILAQYSNGEQRLVGQLALAAIRNPDSLMAVGNNNFQLTARTAMPAIGVPQTGGRGKLMGSSVESSTTDIAQEFTNLIVLQRGYQANARVVTAVDELSQETMNMKR